MVVLVLGTLCLAHAQRGFNPRPAPIPSPGNVVPIVSQTFDLNPDGSYKFSYESGDGSARDETGVPKAPGPEGLAVVAEGSYRYASPEGPVSVNYVANEFGYQPTGSNIHPSILKAVAYLVSEAQKNPNPPPVRPGRPGIASGAQQSLFGKK